jgi:hypothetical protein
MTLEGLPLNSLPGEEPQVMDGFADDPSGSDFEARHVPASIILSKMRHPALEELEMEE